MKEKELENEIKTINEVILYDNYFIITYKINDMEKNVTFYTTNKKLVLRVINEINDFLIKDLGEEQ